MNSLFAQNAEKKSEEATNTPALKDSNSSMENRKALQYQMAAGIIGREYIGSPLTVSLGYFINPDSILNLRYSVLNSGRDDKAAQRMRAVTLGYRHFFGNSFNIMPTVYYRRNTSDYKNEGSFIVFGPSNLIYEDVGIGFRLGNEWQWENFTMGCDWFGINRTLVELNYKQQAVGLIDDIALEKSVTLTLLSFYIGYSF